MLHACPVCSVLPPRGAEILQMQAFARHPQVHLGRRSGKWFFVKSPGCSHGPVEGQADAQEPLIEAWNAWAKEEAVKVAEERGFTAAGRLEEWKKHLGIT